MPACLLVCMFSTCVQYPQRLEESVGAPGTGVQAVTSYHVSARSQTPGSVRKTCAPANEPSLKTLYCFLIKASTLGSFAHLSPWRESWVSPQLITTHLTMPGRCSNVFHTSRSQKRNTWKYRNVTILVSTFVTNPLLLGWQRYDVAVWLGSFGGQILL